MQNNYLIEFDICLNIITKDFQFLTKNYDQVTPSTRYETIKKIFEKITSFQNDYISLSNHLSEDIRIDISVRIL